MNIFSGFLQPPQQRSPLAGAGEFVNDISRLNLSRQQEKNRVAEAATDNARADQYLKLQQTDQASRLTQQDQKQVEALLAEYTDARNSGNPGRLHDAEQMLKRFGMDVSPGARAPSLQGSLPSPASLQALSGQPVEADLSQEEFEQKLIGGEAGAYSDIEQTELASRDALRQRNAVEEPDIAGHLKSVGPLKPLKLNYGGDETVDMGDVDSPEFKKAARDEARPELKNTAPPRLAGGLPTVISRGGKTLYESTGPSGRWSPMVQGVFQPFTSHANPDIGAAAERAQQVTAKLIEVDGVAPKDAIKMGMDYLNGEANRITNLARTELGTRPKYSGGGGAAVPSMKERKPFNDEMNRTYMQFKSEKLDEQFQGYNAGIGAIGSANTASQYDALNRLIQARSGLTVSDKERSIYNNLAGKWEGLVKEFNLLSGGALPATYKAQLKQLMTEARQAVVEEKERRAQAAANFYRAKTRGADPEGVEQDAQAVADAIRMGAGGGPAPAAGGDPNADLYQ